MGYWFLIVIFGLIVVLIVPLFFQIRFYINPFCNMATISITLFGIFVLSCFQVELRKSALNILKPKRGSKEKEVNLLDLKNMFSYMFFRQVFARLRLKEISIFNSVGKRDDAYLACMISGIFLCFAHSFLAVMRTKKGQYAQNVGSIVDCDKDCFKLSGYFSAVISFINIIVSFILAILQKLKSKRRGKYGK